MIKFTCQQCKESLEAPLSLEGESLTCPNCSLEQKIPAPLPDEKPNDPYTTDDPEPAEEEIVNPSGHRPILINSVGEIIMTENSKSVACPVQDRRCCYSCAWFSIDHKANTALCQGHIVIGAIARNEYGKEDDKKTHRWG
jgi:hypothetical protein